MNDNFTIYAPQTGLIGVVLMRRRFGQSSARDCLGLGSPVESADIIACEVKEVGDNHGDSLLRVSKPLHGN